jgi:hypothetical protein
VRPFDGGNQQRGLERALLWPRKIPDTLLEDVGQDVAERGERHLRFRRRRAGRENAVAVFLGRADALAPERRLADSRIALELGGPRVRPSSREGTR